MIARAPVGPVVAVLAVLAVVLGALVGCSSSEPDATAPALPVGGSQDCPEPSEPELLEVEVLEVLPHADDAFTQGLLVHRGVLYESTGRIGESTVRKLDPDTGEELRRVAVDPSVFAEGLAVGADGELVQLTWTEEVAFRRDPDSLEVTGTFDYEGEGWGLTTLDDGSLVMSDGSDELVRRDPEDFSMLDSRRVQRAGGDADGLNELEWDGERLWANRFGTDELLRIDLDPSCATVTGVADLAELRADALRRAEPGRESDVTNGVAHVPGTDRYLLTGKYWPTMYEVRIGGS